MSRWWRAYDEALDDPKLQRLGLEMIGAWFNIICLASKNEGLIRVSDVPFALRLSKQKSAEIITRLAAAGLLDRDGEDYRPHNWGGRQYKKEKGDMPEDSDHKGRYIYFITAVTGGPVKVGISKNPWARIVELQTSHPEKLSMIAAFKTKEVSEAALHETLAPYRRKGGEWFDIPKTIISVVEAAAVVKSDYAALLLLLRSELRQATTDQLRSSYVVAPEQNRAEQSQNQNTEQKEAQQARDRSELDRIEATLRCAAGLENSPSPSLLNLAPILGLLDAGYSLEADIVPSIKAKKNGTKVRGWSYFVPAIRDARAQRVGAASVPAPKGKNDPTEVEKRHRNYAQLWSKWTPEEREAKWHISWNDDCGGPPGSPRCRIPSAILREFGIDTLGAAAA